MNDRIEPSAWEAAGMPVSNPYDDCPYKSLPIEWTAPERLALASLLHGGPRTPATDFRVLELGCADGANLLPMAYYRPHATFVGVDGARTQIDAARARQTLLQLRNVEFVHADFSAAMSATSGQFDYILAHGVFSWVAEDVRDALLELCAERLRVGGLLYLNYNTRPGWNVRGLVREFLLAQTAGIAGLRVRAQRAQEVASEVVASLDASAHPYSQLIANEFRFVNENHVSFVAHEYLAVENHAYWRSEFMALCGKYGFEHVADADFNYGSGWIPPDVPDHLASKGLVGRSLGDTVDLLCYRQLHSPVLTKVPLHRHPATVEELGNLDVASCLVPCGVNSDGHPMFGHPSGFQVEAKSDVIRAALDVLHPVWPRGVRMEALVADVNGLVDDFRLLHSRGLIELRCVDPGTSGVAADRLHMLESHLGYATTPYHTREEVSDASSQIPAGLSLVSL
jgi:SAM-dependent methyltransferase